MSEIKTTLSFKAAGDNRRFDVNQLVGYRLGGCFKKKLGLGSSLSVFGLEQNPVAQTLDAFPLPTSAAAPIGELTISGPSVYIHFEHIMMEGVETIITHRERLRLFRFRVQSPGGEAENIEAQMRHKQTDGEEAELTAGHMGDKYKFSIGQGGLEPLLAFSSSQSKDLVAMRFTSLLVAKNSFFEVFLSAHNDLARTGKSMPITVGFPIANGLVINPNTNLHTVVLEENFGAFLDMPESDLHRVLRAASVDKYEELLEGRLPAFKSSDFINQYHSQTFENRMNSADCVQTATVILQGPKADPYRSLPVI